MHKRKSLSPVNTFLLALLLVCLGCGSDTNRSESVEPDSLAQSSDTLNTASESDTHISPSTLDRLQGTWRSTQDANVFIQFSEDQFVESYIGETVTEESLNVVDACPDGPPGIDGEFFQTGNFCYSIVDLTVSTLSYSMMGGRGNTLEFERSDSAVLAELQAQNEEQGEGRADDALFGEAVCEALRPAVVSGQTSGLERYATPEVLEVLSEDARQGYAPDEADVAVWSDASDTTCNISAGGDAWFELTLMGDGHVGQNAVSATIRTSYDQ